MLVEYLRSTCFCERLVGDCPMFWGLKGGGTACKKGCTSIKAVSPGPTPWVLSMPSNHARLLLQRPLAPPEASSLRSVLQPETKKQKIAPKARKSVVCRNWKIFELAARRLRFFFFFWVFFFSFRVQKAWAAGTAGAWKQNRSWPERWERFWDRAVGVGF